MLTLELTGGSRQSICMLSFFNLVHSILKFIKFTIWNPICERFWVGCCGHDQKVESADRTAGITKREESRNLEIHNQSRLGGPWGKSLGKASMCIWLTVMEFSYMDGDRAIAGRGPTRDIERHRIQGQKHTAILPAPTCDASRQRTWMYQPLSVNDFKQQGSWYPLVLSARPFRCLWQSQ